MSTDFDWMKDSDVTDEPTPDAPELDIDFLAENGDEEVQPPDDTDTPPADFLKGPRRAPGAIKYEKKAKQFLNFSFRIAAAQEATKPDAAALLMHGPPITRALGDLAAADERVARGIDALTEGTSNPYLSMAVAVFPLAVQVLRNHEPSVETDKVGIPIPFTKGKRRIGKFKLTIKLGRVRALSNDPDKLTSYVFNDPRVRQMIADQGIVVAAPTRKR